MIRQDIVENVKVLATGLTCLALTEFVARLTNLVIVLMMIFMMILIIGHAQNIVHNFAIALKSQTLGETAWHMVCIFTCQGTIETCRIASYFAIVVSGLTREACVGVIVIVIVIVEPQVAS